jgi:hypothetical protein
MAHMFTTRQAISAVIALAIVVAVGAAVGYSFGTGVGAGPRMSETKVFRDVPANAGDHQVSAMVNGTTHGVSGDVSWVDASGSWHGGGWPACVPPRSQPRVTFGGAVIFGPTGVGQYRMLWVDCRK